MTAEELYKRLHEQISAEPDQSINHWYAPLKPSFVRWLCDRVIEALDQETAAALDQEATGLTKEERWRHEADCEAYCRNCTAAQLEHIADDETRRAARHNHEGEVAEIALIFAQAARRALGRLTRGDS